MSISIAKKLTLGTIAGLIAMTGALAPASAKGKHHRRHGVFLHLPIVVSRNTDCSFYYWKWQNTGSRYWKRRYFSCVY